MDKLLESFQMHVTMVEWAIIATPITILFVGVAILIRTRRG